MGNIPDLPLGPPPPSQPAPSKTQFTIHLGERTFNLSLSSAQTCLNLLEIVTKSVNSAAMNPRITKKEIVALESTNMEENVDFWLMQKNALLSKFGSGPVLLKPVFGGNAKKNGGNFRISEFRFYKCIGKGGTSKVFLGMVIKHSKNKSSYLIFS